MALVYLDLDGFKAVNDSLGHLAGDDLLVAVARRLEVCLRPGDMVARLGGDEFVVLLSGISNGAAAKQVAERFVKALSQPYRIDERDVRISASAGIALASKEHRQGADLLRAADEAMYRAKELGKCRAELYESPGGMPILPGKP